MLIIEGKTKTITPAEISGQIVIETKDELTGGDAAKKESIAGISVHKTTQTKNVFNLLEKNGVQTAFIKALSESKILCYDCDMLPLELVTRRFAWGSYLKREPTLVSTVEKPHRFDDLLVEFYHKHSAVMPPLVEEAVQMDEGAARDLYLKDGVWKKGVFTDPYIRFEENRWFLHSPKTPVDKTKPLMETEALLNPAEVKELIDGVIIPTFEILEKAWAKVDTEWGPVALVDMKIEVGRRKSDGKLVLADVIDNDSWRIWPGANPSKQLDKQCFREDHPLGEVAEKYQLVAELTDKF